MYELWYDYVKLKCGEKSKLCYMDTVPSNLIYGPSNSWFSNHELDGPLPKGKYKKVIRLVKDELCRKIMTKFVRLKSKTYSYLRDDGSEDKKAKDKKRCFIKKNFKFENYKNLEATLLGNKINYLETNKINIVLKK